MVGDPQFMVVGTRHVMMRIGSARIGNYAKEWENQQAKPEKSAHPPAPNRTAIRHARDRIYETIKAAFVERFGDFQTQRPPGAKAWLFK